MKKLSQVVPSHSTVVGDEPVMRISSTRELAWLLAALLAWLPSRADELLDRPFLVVELRRGLSGAIGGPDPATGAPPPRQLARGRDAHHRLIAPPPVEWLETFSCILHVVIMTRETV